MDVHVPTNGGFAVGSVTDTSGCRAPTADAAGPEHVIRYLDKTGPTRAAPGDTVQFTVFYGRPGAGSLTSITITDTLPPYTHYVVGSATPPPDVGFDPDWGPPPRLQWSGRRRSSRRHRPFPPTTLPKRTARRE